MSLLDKLKEFEEKEDSELSQEQPTKFEIEKEKNPMRDIDKPTPLNFELQGLVVVPIISLLWQKKEIGM